MKHIYLDMNIYNRPHDDQMQTRIKMETVAVFAILSNIRSGELSLIWSFIVDYENSLNPDEAIRFEIEQLSELASMYVLSTDLVRQQAKSYEAKGIKPRDALHVAAADVGGADYFLTCDDRLLKKRYTLHLTLKMMNPIDFIREEGGRIA